MKRTVSPIIKVVLPVASILSIGLVWKLLSGKGAIDAQLERCLVRGNCSSLELFAEGKPLTTEQSELVLANVMSGLEPGVVHSVEKFSNGTNQRDGGVIVFFKRGDKLVGLPIRSYQIDGVEVMPWFSTCKAILNIGFFNRNPRAQTFRELLPLGLKERVEQLIDQGSKAGISRYDGWGFSWGYVADARLMLTQNLSSPAILDGPLLFVQKK
jgi:hypothetical protein